MRLPVFRITFIAFLLLNWLACSTSKPSEQPRIPIQNPNTPRYETNVVLRQKISALESKLTTSPNDTKVLLELATLYQEVDDDKMALKVMEQLSALDYNEDPRLYGSMAVLYRKNEEFEKAKENYLKFSALLPKSSPTISKIDEEIEEVDFIITAYQNSHVINLRPLSKEINTENSEYLPQFTMDDSTIIFTRRFFNQEDLFLAKMTGDGYSVEALDEINTLTNEGAHTISSDGSFLIFTHCDEKYGFGSCDLYKSQMTESGKWSNPSNMGKNINTSKWESQPSLSADGRTLFFASKRNGGYGGSDIYFCVKKSDGTWSIPRNIGSSINTSSNDESPFLHADGRTLYFRSKGYLGLGGYDLYMTSYKDKKWSTPMNMGSPINTTGEDGALVVSLDGTKGYYATDNYKDLKIDHLDLFEFDLPIDLRPNPMTFIKGRVDDQETGFPLAASINISYLDGSEYRTLYKANHNGEFLAAIPVGTPALVNISHEGYLFYSEHISYTEVRYGIDPFLIDISLSKVKDIEESTVETKPIILKNIFFESGSDILLPSSSKEINILKILLVEQPEIKIEINGHTDNVGTKEDNLELSQKRAEAVKNALVELGIKQARIRTKGFGESQPIDTNDTVLGRSNNRRTEFAIVK